MWGSGLWGKLYRPAVGEIASTPQTVVVGVDDQVSITPSFQNHVASVGGRYVSGDTWA